MGLELRYVLCVSKCRQKPWLKEYTDINRGTVDRSRPYFEAILCSFYILRKNAVLGKMMEDVKKRIAYLLVIDEDKFIWLAQTPLLPIWRYKYTRTRCSKPKIFFNEPIFCQELCDSSKITNALTAISKVTTCKWRHETFFRQRFHGHKYQAVWCSQQLSAAHRRL